MKKGLHPIHISEIIDSYFQNRHWNQRIKGYSLLKLWEEMIPQKITQNTKPIKIQNNILFVRVKNHVWANEIKIRKGELLYLLNKKNKKNIIKDILIRIDTNYFNNNQK